MLNTEYLDRAQACFRISMEGFGCIEANRTCAQKIFLWVQQRLESPHPLDEEKIQCLYQLLFESDLREESLQHLQDEYHPAFVIDRLMQIVVSLSHLSQDSVVLCSNDPCILSNLQGEPLWIFKQVGWEKKIEGIEEGGDVIREHTACLLNYHHFYPIPYTAYLNLRGSLGSAQVFKPNCETLESLVLDTKNWNDQKIATQALHKIFIFDVRFLNSDRHLRNIICERGQAAHVYAIDHGCCMSTSRNVTLGLPYLSLDQMIMGVFDEEAKEFIRHLDAAKDAQIMQRQGIGPIAIEWMTVATAFLQHYVHVAPFIFDKVGFELSAADLGFIVLKVRPMLWQTPCERTFQRYLDDVVACKQAVHRLCSDHSLNERNVASLKTTILAQAKQDHRSQEDVFWLGFLYTKFISTYCKCFTHGQITLKQPVRIRILS